MEDTRSGFLATLIPFFRPYSGRIFLAFVALLCAAAASLAMPIVVRWMVDDGFVSQNPVFIRQYFYAFFGIVVVLAVFAAARFYLVTWLAERIIADIRVAVYKHVIAMSPAFFEVTKTGEVLSRITTDTTLVQSAVGPGFSIALRSTIMLTGGLIMLSITHVGLTGIILVLVPLVLLPLFYFGKKVRQLSRESQARIAESSAIAGETLNGIQMIQSFTLEGLLSKQFGQAVQQSFVAGISRNRSRALLTAFSIMIVFGAILAVLWMGTQLVISGRLTTGELSQFLLYALLVATSTAALSEVWGDVQKAVGAMERLMELLHAKSDIVSSKTPLLLPRRGVGRVTFENVTFSYPSRPDHYALRNFSFNINSGETVALVGPSGAGKSTVLQLLLRFYDPQDGHILVGGVDSTHVGLGALRLAIGIVPQQTVIFAANAMENIRYGKPDASDSAVRAAARAAFADEFIECQPEGYFTFLGERGIRLSGGQQQRIAVARALLKNSPIMLLDEATSALDAESEKLVQEALENLLEDRTTLVIAHRLATVLKADRIVVMEKGEIVAEGTHHELVRQGGLYARLAELQFGIRSS